MKTKQKLKPVPKISPVEAYLRAEVEILKRNSGNMYGCVSLSDFVLRNGVEMPVPASRLPKGIPRGRMGRCYQNAGRLATTFNNLIYCEGYALGLFPVLHAWLIDLSTGELIDPTWQGRKHYHATCYYGIAIKSDFLRKRILDQKTWGFIDVPEKRFPMLKSAPSEWRHPVMDKFTKIIVDTPPPKVADSACA